MNNGLEALKELKKETRKGGQYYIVKSEKRGLHNIIEKDLETLEVFSNFEMELEKVKGIDGKYRYFLTIKNERDEELTLFLGGWEKDYNLLKEWLKRL